MLELLIGPVCFVIFVTYVMCSLYRKQQKYYQYHSTEDDINETYNNITNDKYSDDEKENVDLEKEDDQDEIGEDENEDHDE